MDENLILDFSKLKIWSLDLLILIQEKTGKIVKINFLFIFIIF